MWCLVVSIPDLCTLTYFDGMVSIIFIKWLLTHTLHKVENHSSHGQDPGFLERGFRFIGRGGVRWGGFCFAHFSQISHENEIIWSHGIVIGDSFSWDSDGGFKRPIV